VLPIPEIWLAAFQAAARRIHVRNAALARIDSTNKANVANSDNPDGAAASIDPTVIIDIASLTI
jgi:hypothetical protein